MTIGKKILELRRQKELTQKQLSDMCGFSQSALNLWENGKRQPKIAQLKKIAEIFDIALYILIDDDCEIPDTTSDAWKNRARFSTVKSGKLIKDTELEKRPVFTAPLQSLPPDSGEPEHTQENIRIWQALKSIRENYDSGHSYASGPEDNNDFVGGNEASNNLDKVYDDPLSYEHSYSYADSEEEYEAFLRQRQKQDTEPSRKKSQSVHCEPDNNVHKYDASIRINHNLSPETIENLKEVSIIHKKIENGEKLTENDLQILKDYNQRQELAMKRLKETLRTMQEKLTPLMRFQTAYEQLNEIGQEEAAKRVEELTEIPRYAKPPEPPQE